MENNNYELSKAYFDSRLSLSKKKIKKIQSRKLFQTYKECIESVEFYSEKFKQHGFNKNSVNNAEDITKIPFTLPSEIKENGVSKRTAKELSKISLFHTSGGTTGKPKIFSYTGEDILSLGRNVATCFWINGFRKNDVVLGPIPFGETTAGSGLFLGMTMLGASYIPMSIRKGVTDRIITHFNGYLTVGKNRKPIDNSLIANGLLSFPTFLVRLMEKFKKEQNKEGIERIEKISIGAEGCSDILKEKIRKYFKAFVRDVYGIGEMLGPGVAAECPEGGVHILSDTYLAEVINPETEKEVQEGEIGELVLTSLDKVSMPLIRYRTRDKVRKVSQECKCDMNHFKISRIIGRINQDELHVRGGIKIDRLFLEEILYSHPETGVEYFIYLDEEEFKKMKIIIEGNLQNKDSIEKEIKKAVYNEYAHEPEVKVVSYGTIPRSPGKAKRVMKKEEVESSIRLG